MASRGSSLLSNTLILSIGRVVSHVAILATIPLYTFFISTEEYGLVDLVTVYVALLCPLVTLRLESAIFRYLVQERSEDADNISAIIGTSLRRVTVNLLAIVALGFAVVHFVPFRYFFEAVFLLSAISYTNVFMEFARGIGKNKVYSIGQALIGLSTLSLVILLVVNVRLGVQGVLLSIALANIIALAYVAFSLRKERFMGYRDRVVERKLLKYSLPLIPTSMSWWVINVSDRSLIALFIDIGANGIYAVANKVASIPMVLFPVISMALTETAVMNADARDRKAFFDKTFDIALRASFSFIVVLLIAVSLLYDVVIGQTYSEAYQYIPVLLLAVFFNNVTGLYSALYVARKMTKQIMNASIFAAIINLLSSIALLPIVGLHGAAAATVFGYLAMAIYFHRGITGYVHIQYSRGMVLGLIALSACAALVYYLQNTLLIVATLPLFLVYLGVFNRVLLRKMFLFATKRIKRSRA